jgi:hypothetical protein
LLQVREVLVEPQRLPGPADVAQRIWIGGEIEPAFVLDVVRSSSQFKVRTGALNL